MLSPSRPSRRAAASRRKPTIVDSSDDELAATQIKEETEDQDFVSTKATRQSSRRVAVSPTTSPTKNARARRTTRSTESAETLQSAQMTDDAIVANTTTESSILAPRKRTARPSVRANRRTRASLAPTQPLEDEPETPAATPAPELAPASTIEAVVASSTEDNIESNKFDEKARVKPPSRNGTPLADITEQVNNASPAQEKVKREIRSVDPNVTILEKPMDIVIRTRNAGISAVKEPDVPKRRLVITYLVLINFKSYAGRQEVGPFHASFSSVVGPNGSGKSNVIDSLLFVFGFRASKMRQGKLSALIHNSAQYPNLDYCEVEVHFQEVEDLVGGGHIVVPDSTLIVSRRAFRNNSSNYYINSKTSNFTTVTTLLKDRGIDLDHKRFLILQGEVESIAQMKPKAGNEHEDGLLEYLEDIIGTSKYKTPIDESAKETEELNEVCREKNERVKHVENEKNGLEGKKEQALAYVRDENLLQFQQSALYQISAQECKDNLEVTQEAAMKLEEQLKQEQSKHKDGEGEVKRLEKEYKSAARDFATLEKQTQSILAEQSKAEKEGVKIEEKRKFLNNKRKKLDSALESAKFGSKEAETTISQCTSDIARNQDQIAELEQQISVEEEALATIREGLQSKTQGLSDEIAAKQKSIEPWLEKINQKTSEKAVAQSELDMLLQKANAGAVAAEELQNKIHGFADKKAACVSDLQVCEQEQASVKTQMQRIDAHSKDLAKSEPALRAALSDKRQKADEARANLSDSQTQGNVLTGLMRLKDSGRILGFHGRLGNLATIDAKYDVAISTACPSLDNMVVDTVEVGQQCIDYLRKNNLGRANFILLDRLAQRDLSPPQTPENVPRLFDLVKARDEKYRPAFFSVLQNTLVAKDLEQANRIAYGAKRWRVVTLDGQLIDKSGTMSGGGTRIAKGGMSSKFGADITKDQVQKLELDRDAVEQEFQNIVQQKQDLNDTLSQLNNTLPALETKAQKILLEISSIERNIADAERRLAEIGAEQGSSNSDRGQIDKLKAAVMKTEELITQYRLETADSEEAIKNLQNKIMEIGGVRLRSQKAKVDGLKEQVDTLNDEMSSCEVNRTKAEKNLKKHANATADGQKESAKLATDLEKLEQEISRHCELSSGSQQDVEQAQDALETKKEELADLKTELDAKTAAVNESRGVEIDLRNRFEEATKILNDTQRRLASWEDKLGKLSLQSLLEFGEEQEMEELPTYTRDEIQDMDKDALKEEIEQLEARLENVKVDLGVLAEYRRRVDEHMSRAADLQEAVSRRDSAKRRCDELRRLRLEGFMEGFSLISMRLKEMYQMITMGGNAELELVDSLDPFSEGILFSVMPPKKSWKNISNLSGGEKTLSSLALVFALHHYKPTPLYVMDEIDAALDFRNVSIVASYIKERTKNAQFIVISLRNNMFELASRLVGVYKVNHMTKSVTIENKDYLVKQEA